MGSQEEPQSTGIEVDVGGLVVFDNRVGVEGTEIEIVEQSIQPLIDELFSLPSEMTDDGRLVDIPKLNYDLPREKPIPKEKTPTPWEKYAKSKGIQKKKRDRLVWNEELQEYLPRYGPNSAKSLHRDVVLPHKESLALGEDPFSAKKKEKKERIRQEKKKERVNLGRARKARGTKVSPIQALDVAPAGPSGKKHIPKRNLKDAITVAQRSTASAGRFDKAVKNEPKKKLDGRKRKFEAVADKKTLTKEKERAQKVVKRVLNAGK